MHRRNARIPTKTALSHVRSPYVADDNEYKEELLTGLTMAWALASENITNAQRYQKKGSGLTS
jgi:hypothetical protein